MRQFLSAFAFIHLSISPAFAHMGHLGDVAGHAHWISVGVLIAGGVLAAVLGSGKDEDEEEAEVAEDQGEPA